MIQKDTFTDVLVFKTNVCEHSDLEKVASVITADSRIKKWNIDQSDVDNVLRIEAHRLHPADVILLVRQAGFQCEELPD